MKPQHLVVQTEHLSTEAAEWLAARARLVHCASDSAEFERMINDVAALVIRTYTVIDEALLLRAPKLRVIGRAGVGLDNVDLMACNKRNVEVVYTPDANTQAVVEYVIALLLDVLRPRAPIDRAIDHTNWNRLREMTVGERQLNETTLGILGMGRVGKRLAAAARGLGMRVVFNDLIEIPEEDRAGASPVAAQTLFAESDIISIHIDGRSSNRRFVNADLIHRMRSDAIFVNTSRGFVVDNLPLAHWLGHHPQAIALLDVHEPEPFTADYPFLGLANARLYPHLASRTQTAMDNMSWVVRDVMAVLEGRKPQFPAPRSADP